MDEIGIAARGPVHSVILAHRLPLEKIDTVELDPASETSVLLLQVLLQEKNIRPQFVAKHSDYSVEAQAKLLIGDQAIRFRAERGKEFAYWDLAEAWTRMTNLPFVFALWLIRPEIDNAGEIASKLRKRLRRNLANIDEIVSAQKEVPSEFCRKYYREHLCFEVGPREKEGLKEFHRRSRHHSPDVDHELKLNFV